MKSLRKFISVLIILSIFVALPFSISSAAANVIYQSSTKETVTSGATLEKITRFTTEGWLNINVLRVDLTNPNIKVDTLTNTNSVKSLASTKTLAQTNGALAAINGGFFNWIKGTSSAYPDGPVVEAGKIVSADNEYNRYSDSMGTFSINELNQVLYDYWKTDISLIAPNSASAVVMQYNKSSKQDYKDLSVYDRRWSTNTIGPVFSDIIEMIVENGKVSDIHEAQPSVNLPDNSYIVVTRKSSSSFITDNFKVGDPVNLNITTTPDWNNMEMAVTGSALLIKDGLIPNPFSYNISGRHPRTAIGSTKDGKQLILVTVDGRQNSSIGMTQTEMAQLLLELGAFNALNLDGGGSTTLVSRTPGTNELDVVNKPSDGTQRSISNAVGIFSIAPPSALDGLIIDTPDRNVFIDTSREFSVRGYDRYFNPIIVDNTKIQWSVSGVQGYFEGNVFYPQSVGDGKIIASVDNITTELPISVLSAPVQLELSDKSIALPLNQSKSLKVTGKNKNGYLAMIDPADVGWRVSSSFGSMNKGTFKALTQGTGYIEASVGSTVAYCAASVASVNGEYQPVDISQIPLDTVPTDEADRSVDYLNGNDSLRFSVFGESRSSRNLLERVLLTRLSENINMNLEVGAYVGQNVHDSVKGINKPSISTNTGYQSKDIKNSRFIQLDMSNNGLRSSNSGQWTWLLQQLESYNGSNVFLFLANTPQSFSDPLEANLFQEVLTKYQQKTNKNVWVFYKGDKNSSYMEKGIKYITTAGFDVAGLTPDNADAAQYVLVTVNGEGVTFEFKPIVQ